MTGGKGSRLRVSGWGAGEHRRLRQPRLQFCWCRCIFAPLLPLPRERSVITCTS